MNNNNLILAVTQREERSHADGDFMLAHLSYRLSGKGRLLRENADSMHKGGILAFSASGADEYRLQTEAMCRDIYSEVTARSYTGVFADIYGPFSKNFAGALETLGEGLSARKIPFYVTRQYADSAPDARVLVSSEISGGSFSEYLKDTAKDFGSRACLELIPMRMDFVLPSPSGVGKALSKGELNEIIKKLNPQPFFSRELCAKYFTYMAIDRQAHFILFDDADTLRAKISHAGALGVTPVFMLCSDVCDMLPAILEESFS